MMSNEIVLENQKPGNPQSEWDLSGPGSTNIEGFTTDISVNRGTTVDFKINTDAAAYRIDIYRLGYYGGDGARLVASIEHQSGAINQPAPLTDAATGLIDAGNWQVTDTWSMHADSVSGVYIAKLVREDGTFGENHIPFIVRNDEGNSDIVFQTSDTTWQAYNSWGGHSLYDGHVTAAVSYNRPLVTRDAFPWNSVFGVEIAAIRWLEANGYDMSYIAGVDSARSGSELLEHDVFLSVGHDEYWSGEQRANVEAARDAGVNLAFWSGNEVYWKTQWSPSIDDSQTNYRTLITYKETDSGRTNPSGVWTGTWADGDAPTGVQPQNALTGTIFTVNGWMADLKIPHDFAQLRFWRGTEIADLRPGQTASVARVLGHEFNEDIDNGFRPAGLIDLSSTTVDVGSKVLDFTIPVYGRGTANHSLTLYRAESGALVFGAGTVFWAWALDSHHDTYEEWAPGWTGPTDRNVQQAMVNLFADMGVQPQTLQSDLVLASPSSDFVAPISGLSKLNVQVSGNDTTVSLSGSASDPGGGIVAGIEVSMDGGASWHPTTGTALWGYSSNGYQYDWNHPTTVLARAVDDSLNLGLPSVIPATVVAQAILDSIETGGIARADAYNGQLGGHTVLVWNNYDTAGAWNQQSIAYDDGRVDIGYFPQLENQTALVWDKFDVTGIWDLQTIDYSDGRGVVAQLDPMNSEPWSLVWDTYDNVGTWNSQIITYDDGTRSLAYFPELGNQKAVVWDKFDAAGNWSSQSITYGDGTEAVAQLDPLNTEVWYLIRDDYDATGNRHLQTVHYDDGALAVIQFDPLNIEPWSLVSNNYDAFGRLDTQASQYDDGTRAWADIDQMNIANWYSDNYVYDANNNLTSHYQIMDDGQVIYFSSPLSV